MWGGLAASSILEPFVKLYRATAEKKYLDFCQYIVDNWAESKNKPDLLNKALAGKNVFDMFEKPSDDKSKGYMSGGYSKSYLCGDQRLQCIPDRYAADPEQFAQFFLRRNFPVRIRPVHRKGVDKRTHFGVLRCRGSHF